MDAEKQHGMALSIDSRSKKAVQQIFAHKHEVHLECDDKGKVRWELWMIQKSIIY